MVPSQVKVEKLKEKVSQYQKVVLYGAGQMANVLYMALQNIEIAPAFCVVTSKPAGQMSIEDITVYELDDCEEVLKDKNIIIIIAVTEKYEKEISDILQNKGIENWIYATDYFWHSFCAESYYSLYKNQSFKWYQQRINEWEKYNKNKMRREFIDQSDRRIVFVVSDVGARVCKILNALQKKKERVIVFIDNIVAQDVMAKPYIGKIAAMRDQCVFYECIEELLSWLIRCNSRVIHIFSNGWNPYLGIEIIRLKRYLGKVVYENSDIINGMYTCFDEEHLDMEKYCMENADGIVCRGFETEYLIKELNFKIRKVLNFYDYCSSDMSERIKKKENQELSICYVGGIATEKEYPGASYAAWLEFGEKCEINKCHLHIYPRDWDAKRYKDYIEFEKNHMYFHFHKPVPYENLIDEISQYDYGIHPVKSTIGEVEDKGYTTPSKAVYATTNKFFDYLDAGLPIIACSPFKLADMLERENVLIRWSIDEYDFDVLRQCRKRKDYRENVKKARQKFAIDVKIDELRVFYDSL